MNLVQPIRDPALVVDIAEYLKKQNKRNYIMFMTGIYTGLRISDILKLKVGDVKGKRYIILRETKTSKQRTIEISPALKKALADYCKDKEPEEYLIKSREKHNQPITRSMAYKILKAAAFEFGIENIGTHTLRKTFGYHFYNQTKNVAMLMEIFNHTDQAVTLRYIGIQQDNINKAMRNFEISRTQ